jgi:hypothetical protein
MVSPSRQKPGRGNHSDRCAALHAGIGLGIVGIARISASQKEARYFSRVSFDRVASKTLYSFFQDKLVTEVFFRSLKTRK